MAVFNFSKRAKRFHAILLPEENTGLFIPSNLLKNKVHEVFVYFTYSIHKGDGKTILASSFVVQPDSTVIMIDSCSYYLSKHINKAKVNLRLGTEDKFKGKIAGIFISISNVHAKEGEISLEYTSKYNHNFTYEIIAGKIFPKDIRARFSSFKTVWQQNIPNWATKIIIY